MSPNRRRDDEGYDAEASFIKKTMDNPVVTRVLTVVISAALGALAGGSTHTVEDASQQAIVQMNRAEIEGLKAEIARLVEDAKEEESARELAVEKLRDRVLYLEAKTGIRNEPPAAAAAPAPMTPN